MSAGRTIIIGSVICTGLAGCAAPAFLPQDGPARGIVINQASIRLTPTAAGALPYALVPLDDTELNRLQSVDTEPRLTSTDAPKATGQIGVGDILAVTIFEADSGGLFLPSEPGTRAGNFVTLPVQQVNVNGVITIPFAGPLHVAGFTTEQVERKIEAALAAQALSPQAIVTIAQRIADPVSVLGDIANAAHFALDPGGERILGAIARAGGPKFPSYECMVTLQRDGTVQRARLSEIAGDPGQNVELAAGDTIYVSHEPRYFMALGALGVTTSLGLLDRRISFQDSKLNLADALARSGGLEDDRANAKAVFIYRFEDPATLSALGLSPPGPASRPVPTIYLVDLSDPRGLFYASRFTMRSEDTIFVSNAPETDLTKLLSVISTATNSSAAVHSTFN